MDEAAAVNLVDVHLQALNLPSAEDLRQVAFAGLWAAEILADAGRVPKRVAKARQQALRLLAALEKAREAERIIHEELAATGQGPELVAALLQMEPGGALQ